jgi:hypothetical protein
MSEQQYGSANRPMDMEEFAGHDGGGGGRSGSNFLSWKKDDKGQVDVWLTQSPCAVWRHSWHRVVRYKEEGEEKEKVGMFVWNTLEPSEAYIKDLRKQGFYYNTDPDDVSSRKQPLVDPFLKMLEWLFRAVVQGVIDWTDPVFSFEAEDSDNLTIHAGGLLRMYPKNWEEAKKFLDADEIKAEQKKFKERDISLKDSFKENATIQLKYLFVVVDHENLEKGPQVAIEAEALGTKVKALYTHRKEKIEAQNKKLSKAEIAEKANPIRQTCMRWKFDNKKNFSDKYDVIELDGIEITDEIRESFDVEGPDVNTLTGPGNVAFLKQNFESHWCHDVIPPWDEIFEQGFIAAKAIEKTRKLKPGTLTELSTDFKHGANADADDSEEESGQTVECEVCKEQMPEKDMVCPHCKAEYIALEGGIVCLKKQKCITCGENWDADKLKCGNCGAEYKLSEEEDNLGFDLTKPGVIPPKKSDEKKDQPRASRRRISS